MKDIALAWAIRSTHPDFHDWDGLMAWLAGDPARNLAYDQAMLVVSDARTTPSGTIGVIPFARRKAPDAPSSSRRWFPAAIGLAIAAGVAGIMIVGQPAPQPTWRVIEAPADHPRSLMLADGTRIDLSSGGRVQIDAERPRWTRMDRGRAVFTVRHDVRTPYVVVAEGHRIVDAGTTFEVAIDPGSTSIGVAEGRVIVDPGKTGLSLGAGQTAALRDGRKPQVGHVPPATIGQWRYDRLRYSGVPLARVAADLSAVFGHAIVVDEKTGRRPFSGTITPATLRDRPDEAAALLGVRVRTNQGGWELRPR